MSPICFLACDTVGWVWVVQMTGRASGQQLKAHNYNQERPPGAEEVGGFLLSYITWTEKGDKGRLLYIRMENRHLASVLQV